MIKERDLHNAIDFAFARLRVTRVDEVNLPIAELVEKIESHLSRFRNEYLAADIQHATALTIIVLAKYCVAAPPVTRRMLPKTLHAEVKRTRKRSKIKDDGDEL